MGDIMANIQISQIQMPKLRDLPSIAENKVDKGFRFTLLSQLDDSELNEKLKAMIEDITTQGKKIAEHMDIRDMKAYRGMISNFFSEVVANSHKFSRENFLDKRGRHRVYGVVKLVNDKLDELAKELISSQKNQMDILDRVGEIEGLVLDIVT